MTCPKLEWIGPTKKEALDQFTNWISTDWARPENASKSKTDNELAEQTKNAEKRMRHQLLKSRWPTMVGMYNRGYIDRDERLLAEIKESD